MSRSKNELLLMALALLTAACAVIAGTFEAPPLKAQRTEAVYAELPGEEENADAAEVRINLNTASPQELTALEGIGEVKAQAIIRVQQAVAEGIRLINESDPKQGYLTIKSLESLNALAEGKATKIIVPSDIQGLAGLATSLKEIIKE